MIAKEVKETKKIVKFFAEDGTAFLSSEECRNYEKAVERKEMIRFAKSLPHFSLTAPYTYDDECWHWYYLTNDHEFDCVCDALYNEHTAKYCNSGQFSFPAWIAFSVGEDGFGEPIGTSEGIMEEITKFMASLEDGKTGKEASA